MTTDQPPGPLPDEDRKDTGGAGLAGAGVQFAGAIVMCVLVGQWAERRWGFAPWGVLGGVAVGFGAGFYALIRAGNSEDGSRKREDGNGKKGG